MSRAFRIVMSGANENPPNASTATGLGAAVFDDSGANPTLEYTIVTRGLDWGPFTGQAAQTAGTTDNVVDAHFHQAAPGVNGPVRFGWKTHDTNDGDGNDDEFTATNLHLDGAIPVATIHGMWETTDGTNLNTFAGSFTNPALNLSDPTDFYANVHSSAIPGGEIRGHLVLLSTDNGETIQGLAGVMDDILPGLGGDDTISGFDGNDTIDGGSGQDILFGGTGDDRLIGGTESDTIEGGAGADWIDGGSLSPNARNVASYVSSTAGVTIDLTLAVQGGAGDGLGDQLFNIQKLIGSAHNDVLRGGPSNALYSGDVFVGGGGNDTLDGNGRRGIVDYADASSGIVANLVTGVASGTEIGTDTLIDIFEVIGGAGNDMMTGKGPGNVTLRGGNGADTFIFSSINEFQPLQNTDLVVGGDDGSTDTLAYSTGGGSGVFLNQYVVGIENVQLGAGVGLTNSVQFKNEFVATANGGFVRVFAVAPTTLLAPAQ